MPPHVPAACHHTYCNVGRCSIPQDLIYVPFDLAALPTDYLSLCWHCLNSYVLVCYAISLSMHPHVPAVFDCVYCRLGRSNTPYEWSTVLLFLLYSLLAVNAFGVIASKWAVWAWYAPLTSMPPLCAHCQWVYVFECVLERYHRIPEFGNASGWWHPLYSWGGCMLLYMCTEAVIIQ